MMITPLRLALLKHIAGDPEGIIWRLLEDEGHSPAVIRGAEYCGLVRLRSTAEGWRVQITERGLDELAALVAMPALGRPASVQLTLF